MTCKSRSRLQLPVYLIIFLTSTILPIIFLYPLQLSYSQDPNDQNKYVLRGVIANIVNDSSSDYPEWMIGDVYKSVNKPAVELPTLDAKFFLVKISEGRDPLNPLYDFTLINTTLIKEQNNTVVDPLVKGLATVEMYEGSVIDVPTRINLVGGNISTVTIDTIGLNSKFTSTTYLGNQVLVCAEYTERNYCG